MAAKAIHQLPRYDISILADRIVFDSLWEGGANAIETEMASYRVGEGYSAEGVWIANDIQETGLVTATRLTRKEGGLAEAAYQETLLLKREFWNLEWSEIQKDIRNWLMTKVDGSYTEADVYEDLAHVANWEQQKDLQNWEYFNDFKYDDPADRVEGETYTGTQLEGNALILAQKIMKGIESYSLFAPVLTRTTTWANTPQPTGNLGKIDTPQSRNGWAGFGVEAQTWATYANMWLKNIERTTPNGDGTFTLVEGWIGADYIDGDLYPTAGGTTT